MDLSDEEINVSETNTDTDEVETNTDLSDENTNVSETNTNLSDEKANVSEVYSDTDELKVTVTRTIYFKEKETNQDLANPIVQTIDVKETRTGSLYYINHENSEEPNNSILPEVKTPQIKGFVADRDVVQEADVSKHAYYDRVGDFNAIITNTQAIVYYTKVTPNQEQPSLDLEYTEDELKAKEKLTGKVYLYVHKYEPNGEIHEDTIDFSGFLYDKYPIESIIGDDYRLPLRFVNLISNSSTPPVELDEPLKKVGKLIVFHKDYEPNVQADFIYTLNQYYLDENGEKVPIFETPSTLTYHLDVNGLSVDSNLKELTMTGKAKVGSGYISHTKGAGPRSITGVRYQIVPNTITPKSFEHDGNIYVPMSKKIYLYDILNLYVDYDKGETPRQATYSTDVIYYKIPRSESLDVLANTSEDEFVIVNNGFKMLPHYTHIPITSHYSWDDERGLQVTYELKDKDVTQFSDEKVQFEEISFVDLNEEPNVYDKHTAKPTQAVRVKYKLFLDGDKYVQREQIAQMNYKTANDSAFDIYLGHGILDEKENTAIETALTNPNELVTANLTHVSDILIKYDKDGKHLTEVPTAVRVTFTQPKSYRLNGNVLEETFGDITPVGDIQQVGLQLEELRVLDIGKVSKTNTDIDLHVLDSYSGIDKDKILSILNKSIKSYLKQYNQAKMFLLIAKDRIHEANPAYINEFNSDYLIYTIFAPENEIFYSAINTLNTTINYHIPDANAEIDSEEQLEQVALPDDFKFDTVVDEPTQTEKTEVKDSETQTDTPIISDSGVQTDNPSTNDASMQTDEPITETKGTKTDNLDTKDDEIQTTSLSLEEKKPAKTQNNQPNLSQGNKVQYTSNNREGNKLPQSGSKEHSALGTLGVSMMVLGGIIRIFKRKKHTN